MCGSAHDYCTTLPNINPHVNPDLNPNLNFCRWEKFEASSVYAKYLQANPCLPISKHIFYESRCACIKEAQFEECACPEHTLMYEMIRDWDRQRRNWFKDSSCKCNGSACSAGGSKWKNASKSFSALRAFIHAPCGKQSFDDLRILSGPKSNETVQFYARQCCRATLLDSYVPDGMAEECGPCDCCGWGPTTPWCPLEYSDVSDATWKEWLPRIEKDGKSYQEELVVRKGTRREFMEQLRKVFEKCDAHDFIAEWNTHIRNHVYATSPSTEINISTDFAAQHEHKSAYTRTCEHPPRSNMAVFVVTYHEPPSTAHAAPLPPDSPVAAVPPVIMPAPVQPVQPVEPVELHELAELHVATAAAPSVQPIHPPITAAAKPIQLIAAAVNPPAATAAAANTTRTAPSWADVMEIDNNATTNDDDAVQPVDAQPVDAQLADAQLVDQLVDAAQPVASPVAATVEQPRKTRTDVWRIISPAKGDSLFHNTCLGQIIDYYKGVMPNLRLCNVFTDGCRGQYKGKRNFVKVAGFPAEHNNVTLRHRFAASHHFKGPHDAYGKDAKFMARTAEKYGKARLATSHQFYYFCATSMPMPKKLRAKEVVTQMPTLSSAKLEKLSEAPPPPMVPGHESLANSPSAPVVEPEYDEGANIQPIGTDSVDFSDVLDARHVQSLQDESVGLDAGLEASEELEMNFEIDAEIDADNELYLDPVIFSHPSSMAAAPAAPAAPEEDQEGSSPPLRRQRRAGGGEQPDHLQQMIVAADARPLANEAMLKRVDRSTDQMMNNGIQINPLFRRQYANL